MKTETKNTQATSARRRRLTGVVVSNKMQKTVVVKVVRMKQHPVYLKRFVQSQKYKVHDELGVAKMGDTVIFEECRPLSKDKRWRLVSPVVKA